MKKFFFMAATAALALSSCSSDELVQTPETLGQDAVSFEAYSGRANRATTLVDQDFTSFGVFAYEQDNNPFTSYYPTAVAPNFMHNQQVTRTAKNGDTPAGPWIYTPIKYWSNNIGAKASFFGYTPYKEDLTTGNPTLVLNGMYGGPALSYKVPATLAAGVDLCWAEETGKGVAALDWTKPDVAKKVSLNFKHALSRLNFNVEAWVNELTDATHGTPAHGTGVAPNENTLDTNTKIYIKSIKLVGTMANEGVLRLVDGVWVAQTATAQTLDIMQYVNGKVAEGDYTGTFQLGDATSEHNLFADNEYLMLIPGASFKIQIVYDVVTTDAKLPGGKSVVTNVVESANNYTTVAGKAYEYHLNIGLTSVKLEATAVDWNTPSTAENTIVEVALPNNVAASSSNRR